MCAVLHQYRPLLATGGGVGGDLAPISAPARREGGRRGRTYVVSDIERGARNPTVNVIWKLADALDTSPSALFERAEGVIAGRG